MSFLKSLCVRKHKCFACIISFSQNSKVSRNLKKKDYERVNDLNKVNTQAGLQTQILITFFFKIYITLNNNFYTKV